MNDIRLLLYGALAGFIVAVGLRLLAYILFERRKP
jgi:hypothetical protein